MQKSSETTSQKKVCMFVKNAFTHDMRVLKVIQSLVAQGYYVTLFAIQRDNLPEIEIKDGYTVIRLPIRVPMHSVLKAIKNALDNVLRFCGNLVKGAARLGKKTLKRLSGQAISSTSGNVKTTAKPSLPQNRNALSHNLQIFFYNLAAFRQARKINALYFHANDLDTLPAALLANWAYGGKGTVYDSHEIYPEMSVNGTLGKRMLYWLDGVLSRRASHIITVNDSIAQIFATRYKVPAPQVMLNCSPLSGRPSPETIQNSRLIRDQLGIPDERRIVLYQGGFSPNRGLENLLLVAPKLKNAVMVFMGWGHVESELRRIREQEKLEDCVYIIPPASPETLLDYTCGADVGVVSVLPVGLNNYYATPNKLFEYTMAGVPIAGCHFPEVTRILNTYGIGYTYDPYNSDSIAEAINRVLDDRQRLSENTQRAALELCWEKQEPVLLGIYDQMNRDSARA